MRNAALHLALDEQRVDLRAAVVDGDVLVDGDLAGLAVDIDRADVRPERVGEVARLEEARRLEAGLDPGRQALRHIRGDGNLGPRDLAVRHARRRELAVGTLHVIGSRLEQVRGERLRLGEHLVNRHDDRRAADHHAAAAVGVAPVVGDLGVAVQDDDVFDRHAKPVGRDLGEGRLLPLAVGRDAGNDGDFARHFHPHAAPFPAARRHRRRRPHAADLDVGGDADAEQPPGGTRGGTLLHQLIPVGELLRLDERLLVVAAVVGDAARGRKRKFVRQGKMFEAQLEAIDADLPRDHVHQPLDQVSRLRAAGAAIGVGRHLVRVHAGDVDLHRRDPVAAGQHQAGQRRNGRRQQLTIRSEIRNRVRLDSENRPVVLHRDLVIPDLVAAVNRRGGVLAARFDPFHRGVQLHRQVGAQRFFTIDVQLRAEAAAHFGRDDAQLVFGDADHCRQQRPEQMRNLRRRPQRQRAFAGVIRRDHRARLDRHRRQPLVIQPVLDDAIGAAEGVVDVAAADRVGEGYVAAQVGMRERAAALERFFRIGDHRQRLVIDVDRVDGIARDVRIGGDRDRHRVADEIDAIAGQQRVRRCLQARDLGGAGNQPARIVHVGAGKDSDDAGNRFRGCGVHAFHPGVGVRTAENRRVQHPRQAHIVGVGADALHQPRIFDALQRAPDVGSGVSHAPPPRVCGRERRRPRRSRPRPAALHR